MLRRYAPVVTAITIFILTTNVADAFTSSARPTFSVRSALSAKKKGFGTESPKKKAPKKSPVNAVENVPAPAAEPQLNAGQRALEQMRREQAEQKDAELRRVRDMMKEDEQVQEAAAAIPEKVAQRMGQRMLSFVGVPLFGLLGSFVAFWYFATYKDLAFEPSQVAASTILILVVGLGGITYSVMSASWDPDREGGALGVDEFKTNVANIQDGLKRSRENAILREKVSGLSEGELEKAFGDLDRKEAKKQTLENKIQEELD